MNVPLLSTGLVAVLAAAALFEPASAAAQDSPRGFLGVFLDDLSITGTVPGSPAAGAGLQAGDRLLELDGMELDDAAELQSLLSERAPGREVRLVVMRDLRVTLGQRPEGEGGWLGVSLEEAGGGVRLTEVQDGSPAEAAGVRVGDVVVAVNGDGVDGFDALAGAIGGRPPGTEVTLTVHRAFELELGAAPSELELPSEVPEIGGIQRIRVPVPPPLPLAPAPGARGDGYLGVSLTGDGQVIVDSVVEGSPAAAAGLRAGDQILAFDASSVASIEDLASAIRAAGAGSEIVLDVLRDDGEEFERVAVTLGARPRESAGPAGAERAELEERMEFLQDEMRALSEEYGARMRDLGAEMRDLGRALGYESLELNVPFPMSGEMQFGAQEADRYRAQAEEARRQAAMAREMAERARVEAMEAMERERARAAEAENRAEAGVRAEQERAAVRDQSIRLRDEVRELREELRELRRALAESREGGER